MCMAPSFYHEIVRVSARSEVDYKLYGVPKLLVLEAKGFVFTVSSPELGPAPIIFIAAT